MKENLRTSLDIAIKLEKISKRKLLVIAHILDKNLPITDQMTVEVAELWNQTKFQADTWGKMVESLVEAIKMDKEFFDHLGDDFKFDKELGFTMEPEDEDDFEE